MPADAATELFFCIDYGTTPGYYFKGKMTGWFQSNDTALSAAKVSIAWNSGVYDIDTTEAIGGLVDSIGFTENSTTTYDNALNAGLDGAGTGTPLWVVTLDLGRSTHDKGLEFWAVGENTAQSLLVDKIVWEGEDIDDGNELSIVNITDDIVFHAWAVAADTGDAKSWSPPNPVHGLKVKTMTNGVCRVYLA